MFWGILASFLAAADMLAFKRRLAFARQAGLSNYFTYFFFGILVLAVLPFIHVFVSSFSDYRVLELDKLLAGWKFVATLFATAAIGIGAGLLSQYAYTNEKVSILTPWDQSTQLWVILLGYLTVSSGTSVVSLASAVAAALAIIVGNLQGWKIRLTKPCLALGGAALLRAIATLLIASMVKGVSASSVVFGENVFSSAFLFCYLVYVGGFRGIGFSKSVSFAKVCIANVLLWLSGFIITLILFKQLGVVVTSLLSMLTVVLVLVANWVFLGDRPAKRELLVSGAILACVSVGAILR